MNVTMAKTMHTGSQLHGRLLMTVIFTATSAGFVWADPPTSKPTASVPIEEARKQLVEYRALIQARFDAMVARYGANAADDTLKKAIVENGGPATGNHNWADGLFLRWNGDRGFYFIHMDALDVSLKLLDEMQTVNPEDLAYLKQGMEDWKADESKVQKAFADLVKDWGREIGQGIANKAARDKFDATLPKDAGGGTALIDEAMKPYNEKTAAIQKDEEADEKLRNELVVKQLFSPLTQITRVHVSYAPGEKRSMALKNQLHEVESIIKVTEAGMEEDVARYEKANKLRTEKLGILKSIWASAIEVDSECRTQKLKLDYIKQLLFMAQLREEHADDLTMRKQETEQKRLENDLKDMKVEVPNNWPNLIAARLKVEEVTLEKAYSAAKEKSYEVQSRQTESNDAFHRADVDTDLAQSAVTHRYQRLAPLQIQRESLADATQQARLEGDPMLTRVVVTTLDGAQVYAADWFDPAEAFRQVNAQLDALKPGIDKALTTRDQIIKEYTGAKQDEFNKFNVAGNTVWWSALAQASVEMSDFIWDICKSSAKQKNWVSGSITAIFKKTVDLSLELALAKGDITEIGGYKFIDEQGLYKEMQAGAVPAIDWRKEGTEAGKKIGMKVMKDLAGASGSILAERNKQALTNLAETLRQTIVIRTIMEKLPENFSQFTSGMKVYAEKARNPAPGDLFFSAVKAYSKSTAKKLLSQLIEEPAWREAFVAEDYRIGLHRLLVSANEGVGDLIIEKAKMQALHDWLISMYDQNDISYYHGEGRQLAHDEQYLVQLYFRGAKPNKVTVTINGKETQPKDGQVFLTTDKNLRGIVHIDVVVESY